MTQSDSSLTLLARARAGDAAAVEALVARLLPRLRRWASGRLPPASRDLNSTDDIVQETLIATLRNLDGFQPRHEGALNVYLRQALRRRVLNERRRTSRLPGLHPLEEASETAASTRSPLGAVLDGERREAYEQALSQLSEEDREAIIGRLEFGCSYQELADAWGKPSADAARKTVERAVLRLAAALTR